MLELVSKKHKPKCWNVGIALSESLLLMKEVIRRGMVKNGQWKKKKYCKNRKKFLHQCLLLKIAIFLCVSAQRLNEILEEKIICFLLKK